MRRPATARAGVTTDGTNPVDTVDFGYQPTGFSSIGDLVWNDADGDGLLGVGESGLVNVIGHSLRGFEQ